MSLTAITRPILDPLRRVVSDAEEIGQLLHTQTANVLASFLIQRLADQSTLPLLQLDDSVFDSVLYQHSVHFNWSRLANAVRTVNSLFLNVGIPERIENYDLTGLRIEERLVTVSKALRRSQMLVVCTAAESMLQLGREVFTYYIQIETSVASLQRNEHNADVLATIAKIVYSIAADLCVHAAVVA